ncbi:MAG: mobile mystery protein A [Pseudomonadota bacterium]
MKKFKQLQLKTLDNYLSNVRICEQPSDGWIRSVRKAIGMSVAQLAERIGITHQTASQLEANELDNSITLRTLRRAAEAMDCKLVYAIIPNYGSLQDIVKKQAYRKAKTIVKSVDHTMLLEAQQVGNLEEKITETADELAKELNSKLWNK